MPRRAHRRAAGNWHEACCATAGGVSAVRIVGILLIVFGVLAIAYGGFRYTTREKVVDVGPLQATTERHHEVSLPPIVGIAAIVGGVALLVSAARTRV
jgi:uncharacterized membrane protein YidH (DUF202 family)